MIFQDITKLNIYATFLYLSKRYVILSLKTDFTADCIVKSRFYMKLSLHTTSLLLFVNFKFLPFCLVTFKAYEMYVLSLIF